MRILLPWQLQGNKKKEDASSSVAATEKAYDKRGEEDLPVNQEGRVGSLLLD